MIYIRVIPLAVWAVLFALSSAAVAQEGWSSFQNGGTLQDETWDLALDWSETTGIEWQVELPGYGQSSPILHGETAYITSVSGDNKETLNVKAINIKDGSESWIYHHANSTPEKNTVMVSRAASSPVADELGVIAFFEGGNLIALDHEGELRWERDLTAEFGALKARHGLAASLEQNAEHVFV